MVHPNDIKIYLCDVDNEMCYRWKDELLNRSHLTKLACVEIYHGTISTLLNTHTDINAIVAPGNSYGIMSGGYDAALVTHFGNDLMETVMKRLSWEFLGEQPVGTSTPVWFGTSKKAIIYTPTMRIPHIIEDWYTVYHCTRSALICAMTNNLDTIVLPAFGAGTGRVPAIKVAQLMIDAIQTILYPPSEVNWQYACKKHPLYHRTN